MNRIHIAFYQGKLDNYILKKNKTKALLRLLSFLRLLVFVLVFVSFYLFFGKSQILAVSVALIFLGFFLFLLKYYNKKALLRDYYTSLVDINKNEIDSLKGNYSMFDNGEEHTDKEHEFTFDLDIFGKGSLFQFLNRSVIKSGSEFLADMLKKPNKNVQIIKARQKSIKELAAIPEWRQDFMSFGKLANKENLEIDGLNRWLSGNSFFNRRTFVKVLINFLSLLTILIILASAFGMIHYSIAGISIVYQFVFYTFFAQKINNYHAKISSYSKILDNYSRLLHHTESINWKTEYLIKLVTQLKQKHSASTEIKKLSSLLGALDTRLSFLLAFILNWIFLWDLQCIVKMEEWKEKNRAHVNEWFSVLSEIDALQSFANFAYNHPEYTTPGLVETEFQIQGVKIGHPLISGDNRICNDFSQNLNGKFSIVTGANMAGKSTFLRTIGINLILAMTGAPVCAEKFKFTPINLYSSMRTDDSLQRNKSYFFSELERLKAIFDKLNNGEQLFLILDEILKGTNSKDKEVGSKAFLKKLIKFKSNGIIATHDLSLGELELEFPKDIINQCFEVKISEKELEFDYKLYPGITKNLNASFLLQKMGIV